MPGTAIRPNNRPDPLDGAARSAVHMDSEGTLHRDPGPVGFEPLLDSTTAAKLLQIHPKTLQKLARIGRVPAHNVCGLWRFRASELDDWLTTAISSKCHSRSN
jgi:excisionase family DNA binding protein